MHTHSKAVILYPTLLFVSCCLFVVLSSQPVMAQQAAATNELGSLKEEIKSLKATQQQILERLDELKKILRPEPPTIKAPAQISIQDESFRGSATAKVAIVEYADFECPFCGRYKHDTFPQLMNNYIKTGTVKYYYRDFPLAFHENALPASRAARCAGEQGKFWEMHDSLFADQKALSNKDILTRAQSLGMDSDKLQKCLSTTRYVDEIQKNIAEATKMEISGTPTFLIGAIGADGTLAVKKTIIGAYPYEAFKSALDEVLASEHPKDK